MNLLAAVDSANFKSAAKAGRLSCPGCGVKPPLIPQAADDALTCTQCGVTASALEWSIESEERKLVGDPDQMPAESRINRRGDMTGGTVWEIPASGRSGGMLIFAVIWCTFIGIISGGFLFGAQVSKPSAGSVGTWWIIPFFSVFWIAGIVMLYAACRNKFASHRLTVNRTSITLRRELFGLSKERTLPTDSVVSIEQVEFYQQNYKPVRGVEIRGKRSKLRFGSILTDAEKAWLVADLRRVVFGAAKPVEASSPSHRIPTRQSHFSIPLPQSRANLIAPGIILLLMGIGFVLFGILVIGPDVSPVKTGGSILTLISNGFPLIWTLMSAGMATLGLVLLIRFFLIRNQTTHLDGTEGDVTLRTTRSGRVLSQRVFPRASVVAIRASASGSVNNKTVKRVELITGGKAETLVHWMDGDTADAFVEEVRRVLF